MRGVTGSVVPQTIQLFSRLSTLITFLMTQVIFLEVEYSDYISDDTVTFLEVDYSDYIPDDTNNFLREVE